MDMHPWLLDAARLALEDQVAEAGRAGRLGGS